MTSFYRPQKIKLIRPRFQHSVFPFAVKLRSVGKSIYTLTVLNSVLVISLKRIRSPTFALGQFLSAEIDFITAIDSLSVSARHVSFPSPSYPQIPQFTSLIFKLLPSCVTSHKLPSWALSLKSKSSLSKSPSYSSPKFFIIDFYCFYYK